MAKTRIIRRWNYTARRILWTLTSDIAPLHLTPMGETREEAARSMLEINNRREKLGLDSLSWSW
jgi:hypothetical protein